MTHSLLVRALPVSIVSLGLVLASVAHAGRFSDVPDQHVFHDAIERLADKGIVTGNPDGTFKPFTTVNRAEFLTMLYRTKGLTPSATAVCMRDVIAGSWYLPVVCDAISRGYVGGYVDGTFKPQNPVTRVEATKMLLTVLDFPIREFIESDRAAIGYPDVSLDAWYTKYLAASFRNGILPVAGQSPDAFGPNASLTRAEAVAYIDSAIRVSSIQSSSSSQAVSSSASAQPVQASSAMSSSSSSLGVKNVTMPITDSGLWQSKTPVVYRFAVEAETVAEFTVTVPNQKRTAQCTLYRLGSDDLPIDYYIGSVDDNRCFLRVTMSPGNYQLETRGQTNGTYALATRMVKGDGNDGFSEARTLIKNSTRVGALEVDDQADYYTFTVVTPTTYLVETSNSARARCTILPMPDVDLSGPLVPECNVTFTYPVGTYIVVMDRQPELIWNMETYGVVLKPTAN